MSPKKKTATTIFDQSNQNVTHQVNIAGGENQTNRINLGASQEDVFAQVLEFISASNLAKRQKSNVIERLEAIEKEIAKGDNANTSLLETLLKGMVEQIPEIATVLLTAILDPAAGAVSGVKMIASKILKNV